MPPSAITANITTAARLNLFITWFPPLPGPALFDEVALDLGAVLRAHYASQFPTRARITALPPPALPDAIQPAAGGNVALYRLTFCLPMTYSVSKIRRTPAIC
jgi:hypothetical protein